MNPLLKKSVSAIRSPINFSCLPQRLCKLTIGIGSIALLGVLVPQAVRADTATITNWTNGSTSHVSNIAAPGVQNTTFNINSIGPFLYTTNSFYVGTSGVFTATSTTPALQNTTYFLKGLFSPGTPTTTPYANYLVSVYSGNNSPLHTANFSNLSLTAGQQYTVLVAYNATTELYSSTVSINGGGCIRFGATNLCGANFAPVANSMTGGVANTLDNMINGSAGMTSAIAALSALDNTQRAAALEKLTPSPSRGSQVATQSSMSSAFNQIGFRLDGLRSSDGAFNAPSLASSGGVGTGLASGDDVAKSGVWMKAYGLGGRQGQKDGFAGYKSSGWGMAAGADRQFAPGLIGGVALSYSDTSLSYRDQLDGNGTGITSTQVSVYGSQEIGRGYVDGILAYAKQKYDSHRDTVVSGQANANYTGDQWGARVGAGLPIALSRDFSVTPQARLEWNHVNQKAYTENGGGALALSVGSSSAERIRTSLGGQLNYDTSWNNIKSQPFVRAFWNHDFKNDGVDSAASFVGGGTVFTTAGQKLDRDTYSLGLGANFFTRKNFTATLAYDLTLGSSYQMHMAQATARWVF